jgi:hypothetical protein
MAMAVLAGLKENRFGLGMGDKLAILEKLISGCKI